MLSKAALLETHCNTIVLGRRWNGPQNHERQIALFGVVEGAPCSANLHMHLVLYSRTELFDEDMHELCWQLHKKRIVSEFWVEPSSDAQISGHHNYILKEFQCPHGAALTDRVFVSQSLGRIIR